MENNSAALPTREEIQKAVNVRFEWGINALQNLISIDSISPHEYECQEALAGLLRAEGLPVELVPLDDGTLRTVDGFRDTGLPLDNRPNLVAFYGGKPEGGRSLILNAHIDTEVWEDQLEKWLEHPLSGVVRDGKVYGRGAMDDKGQVVAAAMAILALKDLGYEPRGRVIFESVVAEEPSGNGTLALCSQGYLADAAIVLEATDNHIAYGHRGVIGIHYTTIGKVRHASVREDLPNSIVEAGRLANILDRALEEWNDPSDALYGPPSVNVGKIEGGDSIFTTPQKCRIWFGVRYAPGTYNALMDHINKHLRGLGPKEMSAFEKVETEVFSHSDAAETPIDSQLVQTLSTCVREIEPDRQPTVFRACCDARHLINRYQVPTVIFGPSQIHLAHAENEYLDLAQWQLAIQELALFITRWCQ